PNNPKPSNQPINPNNLSTPTQELHPLTPKLTKPYLSLITPTRQPQLTNPNNFGTPNPSTPTLQRQPQLPQHNPSP
ncbi:PREDICTED: sporozoite surface protein 2-like, partial [Pterocles gutturalis]|uniref:sporozoite surface protein 2-like n=1 Tax=Pterocles gutturalis TaxID=240206 RepID=UPI0005283174